ncbi:MULTISPECIES: DUF2058 domain-containing protein [Vibrio]|uniref:DUF2058 domain-containing protein n=1 Tax=Vibrio TaxID=662 RepID=UPI000C17318A|nr:MULTISPECIES: DUF2058 domain-containing protein [Vibrio]NAW69444.1 DUF2058 family protein [Vibrio sp. V28_P6S34P95]NAX05783.1 DUF2058 family protein [Vibrio sp. V30_P3S12P165]NAX34999.1 DUF2058 family protein [Vibrio sp. V29_P1S30P107]NAX38411.1 DUF2058 family protein [Vibrio sp. V27_P1S3P104]NNN43338.1 DUF2058 domain-containing protein [Vibrio sp. 1-1(7)]
MTRLSLQEQMLKAGLVNEKKLKKAKKGSKKSRLQAREVKAAVEASKQEQLERDKEFNKQQKEQLLTKEIRAQVKQLIEMNKLPHNNGDIQYHFTDGNLVKKLYVDKQTQDQLSKGHLAIARYEEGYAIIPNIVAQKIWQRDEHSIIPLPEEDKQPHDEDDPYADFVVPDDLMW